MFYLLEQLTLFCLLLLNLQPDELTTNSMFNTQITLCYYSIYHFYKVPVIFVKVTVCSGIYVCCAKTKSDLMSEFLIKYFFFNQNIVKYIIQ